MHVRVGKYRTREAAVVSYRSSMFSPSVVVAVRAVVPDTPCFTDLPEFLQRSYELALAEMQS